MKKKSWLKFDKLASKYFHKKAPKPVFHNNLGAIEVNMYVCVRVEIQLKVHSPFFPTKWQLAFSILKSIMYRCFMKPSTGSYPCSLGSLRLKQAEIGSSVKTGRIPLLMDTVCATPSTRKEGTEKKAKLGERRGTSIGYMTRIKSEYE